MFCPNCGKQMNYGASFCPNCGFRKGDESNNFQFNANKSSGFLSGKTIIGVLALVVAFVIFKIVTSFGEVVSFKREVKTLIEQLENEGFEAMTVSIIENNIDFEGSPEGTWTPGEAKEELMRAEESEEEVRTFMSIKPSKKLVNELNSAFDVKYSVKKIGKDHVRINIKHNFPRVAVLFNPKIRNALTPFASILYNPSSYDDFTWERFFGTWTDFTWNTFFSRVQYMEKEVINLLNVYKSLSKNDKLDVEFYVDFYKSNGHWKYKCMYYLNDAMRLFTNGYWPIYVEWSSNRHIFGFY